VDAIRHDQIHGNFDTRLDSVENRRNRETCRRSNDVFSKGQRIFSDFADFLDAIRQCVAADNANFLHFVGTSLNAERAKRLVDVSAVEVAEVTLHESGSGALGRLTVPTLVLNWLVHLLSVVQMTLAQQEVQVRVSSRTLRAALGLQVPTRVIPWTAGGVGTDDPNLNTVIEKGMVLEADFAVLAADMLNTVKTLLARRVAASLVMGRERRVCAEVRQDATSDLDVPEANRSIIGVDTVERDANFGSDLVELCQNLRTVCCRILRVRLHKLDRLVN